jgi:hypothetical protein
LIQLELGWYFNKLLSKLPPALIILIFGNHFNQPLPRLSPRLKLLMFGSAFNHKLLILPYSLKYLILERRFNHKLPKPPSMLTNLNIGYDRGNNRAGPIRNKNKCEVYDSDYVYINNLVENLLRL